MTYLPRIQFLCNTQFPPFSKHIFSYRTKKKLACEGTLASTKKNPQQKARRDYRVPVRKCEPTRQRCYFCHTVITTRFRPNCSGAMPPCIFISFIVSASIVSLGADQAHLSPRYLGTGIALYAEGATSGLWI